MNVRDTERLKTKGLRKLGNFKKIPEMLRFDRKSSTGHPRAKFRHFSVNCKISAVRHYIEKPILLNFVNLCTTLCPRLSEETDIHF